MNYQREYATLVGQVDRAITLLEACPAGDAVIQARCAALLLDALLDAEEQYIHEV